MIDFTKKLLFGIFQGFCLTVSEELFYKAPISLYNCSK